MTTPLENYEPIDMDAPKDPDLQRSPEKYFRGVFRVGIAIGLIGSLFYDLPSQVPYHGAIRGLTVAAFLGIIATTIYRAVSKSR